MAYDQQNTVKYKEDTMHKTWIFDRGGHIAKVLQRHSNTEQNQGGNCLCVTNPLKPFFHFAKLRLNSIC